MKRLRRAAGRLALLAALVAALCAAAPEARAWTAPGDASGWGALTAGFAAGLAAHEAGHLLVAKSLGVETQWHGLSITYPDPDLSPQEHFRVASAGIQTQWLVSEAAFLWDRGRVESDFAAGAILAHLVTSAAYLTVLKDHSEGDLRGMETASGIHRDKIAAYIAVPFLLDTWRLFDPDAPKWAGYLSIGLKGYGIGYVWNF